MAASRDPLCPGHFTVLAAPQPATFGPSICLPKAGGWTKGSGGLCLLAVSSLAKLLGNFVVHLWSRDIRGRGEESMLRARLQSAAGGGPLQRAESLASFTYLIFIFREDCLSWRMEKILTVTKKNGDSTQLWGHHPGRPRGADFAGYTPRFFQAYAVSLLFYRVTFCMLLCICKIRVSSHIVGLSHL